MMSNQMLSLDAINLASGTTVTFDRDKAVNTQIKHIWRAALFHLHGTANIIIILSQSDAKTLVHECETSRLSCCNSLLSGCSESSEKSRQPIQNAAVRLTERKERSRFSHISLSPLASC